MILVIFLAFFALYIFVKLTSGRTNSKVCLLEKTAIITGGNEGIGFEIALNLASRGCKIIIADKSNSNNVPEKIYKLTNNPNVVFKYLDLTSLKSIRKFASEILLEEKNLHILINNAGVGENGNKYTEDGLHSLMQCNTLGPFLLTHLLSGLLKQSAPSRIIFTSSLMAFTHNLTSNMLNYPEGHPNTSFTNCRIYSNANLANIIISDMFAHKLMKFHVCVNSAHPGMAKTRIFDNFFKHLRTPKIVVIMWNIFMAFFAKSAEEGAQTTIHLAVAKEVENLTGHYFWDCIQFPKPRVCSNTLFCNEIWKKCEELVGLKEQEKL